jgi:hypothetical protein
MLLTLTLTVALMLLRTADANLPTLVPNPLAGTGFPSEHDNFLCSRFSGNESLGDTFELPCRSPREDWEFKMKDQFVISAWWPPTLAAMPDYAAAGFNLVMGGNIGAACQSSGAVGTPATIDEMFDCVAKALPAVDKLGLKFAWGVGFFKKAAGLAGVRGGPAGFGGVIDSDGDYIGNISVGAVSSTELAWVVGQLRERNLTHIVASYFLHDDVVTVDQATIDAVAWLRDNARDIVPQVNSGSAATLYASRQHILSPEEYEINGAITNASQETANQLLMFAGNQYVAERFGLDNWPLFNVGDGGGNPNVRSDSLVRVQVYGAIAYGSRGLYYYCWVRAHEVGTPPQLCCALLAG